MGAVTARAVRHIEAVAREAPVLCVSHCDVIRGVVAHYLGLTRTGCSASTSIPHR